MVEEKAICVKCEFCEFCGFLGNSSHRCLNENAPVTSYVTGEKCCHVLNYDGRCKHFRPKPQNLSRAAVKELACPECGHIMGCLAPLCGFRSKVTT